MIDDVGMRGRGRGLVWGGVAVAMAALAWLAFSFAKVGLEKADQLASVLGLFVAVAGFGVAAFGQAAQTWGTSRSDQPGRNVIRRPSPQRPAAWPHQVGVIPSRAQSFQHRAEADRLQATVDGGGTALLSQVLTGMGGVGKTQLAADYARTTWGNGSGDDLDVLVWVTASDRSAVVSGYAQAGVQLCRADPNDADQAAQTFIAWLDSNAGAKRCRWLIVLDDVADPDDLRDLWPPPSPYGRTLVTTRRRDAALTGDTRRRIDIGLFTENEALNYLTARLPSDGREPQTQVAALARELGHLPLALSQAATYIIDSGDNVATYRERLAKRATQLKALAPDRYPDDQALPLAAVWSVSIDRADFLTPPGLARPMLQLVAMLDSHGIPRSVLTSEPALIHLAKHRTRTDSGREWRVKWWPRKRPRITSENAAGALQALARLSLVDPTHGTAHPGVSVHQLVQRATRDTLASKARDRLACTAADALVAAWPEIERDTGLAQVLRSNTTALSRIAEEVLLRNGHRVLIRLGNSVGESGRASAARDYFADLASRFRANRRALRGIGFAIRINAATWRGIAGDPAQAATELEKLLEDQEKAWGPKHPNTLLTRNHLAMAWGEAGDPAKAAEELEKLLKVQMKVRHVDKRDALITLSNLIHWRGQAGQPAEETAAQLRDLLKLRTKLLGAEHLDTLLTRNNLAVALGEADKSAKADYVVNELEQLLEVQLKELSHDHWDIFITRLNLAEARGRAGDAPKAISTLEELLEADPPGVDLCHPVVLTARWNLAQWRIVTRDTAKAIPGLQGLLEDQKRVLGEDHPDIYRTRFHLSQAWALEKNLAKAKEEVQAICVTPAGRAWFYALIAAKKD